MSLTRPVLLIGLAAALALFLAASLAAAAWLVFVPRRPMPDGPQAVGRAELVLRDSSGKPLPVTIWYPAAGPAGRAPV